METYHSDVIECFIWDLQETSQRRTNGTSKIRTTETSWWRATETSLGVSFETCLRRWREAPMGRRCCVLLRRSYDVPTRCRGDVPLRRLGDVPPRCHWVFHLRRTCDVAETYRETSLQHCHDVLMQGETTYYHIACLCSINICYDIFTQLQNYQCMLHFHLSLTKLFSEFLLICTHQDLLYMPNPLL